MPFGHGERERPGEAEQQQRRAQDGGAQAQQGEGGARGNADERRDTPVLPTEEEAAAQRGLAALVREPGGLRAGDERVPEAAHDLRGQDGAEGGERRHDQEAEAQAGVAEDHGEAARGEVRDDARGHLREQAGEFQRGADQQQLQRRELRDLNEVQRLQGEGERERE